MLVNAISNDIVHQAHQYSYLSKLEQLELRYGSKVILLRSNVDLERHKSQIPDDSYSLINRMQNYAISRSGIVFSFDLTPWDVSSQAKISKWRISSTELELEKNTEAFLSSLNGSYLVSGTGIAVTRFGSDSSVNREYSYYSYPKGLALCDHHLVSADHEASYGSLTSFLCLDLEDCQPSSSYLESQVACFKRDDLNFGIFGHLSILGDL